MARLIDTSLWIDFTRKKSPAALKAAILPWIMAPDACLCEPIAFEILRHATALEKKHLQAQFATLPFLSTPPTLWRDATQLGSACRAKGVNAGSQDLLIAASAIHHQAELITFDADFLAISRCTGLRLQLLNHQNC